MRNRAIKPDEFPYRDELLSLSGSAGQFPDLAIRINQGDSKFLGGELIEVKDSQSGYGIASFNSTIPSGTKSIREIAPKNSKIYRTMEANGDDVYSLSKRDVYYLVRGRKGVAVKICLVHGSFFGTASADKAIAKVFEQVLDEAISESKKTGDTKIQEAKKSLLKLRWKQDYFSKVRKTPKASVSIRFRIMTEAIAESNMLNPKYYPEILDNTLNLIVPLSGGKTPKAVSMAAQRNLLKMAFGSGLPSDMKDFEIKHKRRNGRFGVFQCPL